MPAEATVCFISFGSNLGDSQRIVSNALMELRQVPLTRLVACSPFYRSRAIGPGTQRDYLNGVVQVETRLQPESMLDHLQEIETGAGRTRNIRWGERTLDLDLLLFGDMTLDTNRLTLPHPRMKLRNFVLFPLADLAPALELPCGRRVADLCRQIGRDGLLQWITEEEPREHV